MKILCISMNKALTKVELIAVLFCSELVCLFACFRCWQENSSPCYVCYTHGKSCRELKTGTEI